MTEQEHPQPAVVRDGLIGNVCVDPMQEQLRAAFSEQNNRLYIATERATALEAENKRLREMLARWYQTGCPDCSGDCGAANPPVNCCIVQETRAALKGDA